MPQHDLATVPKHRVITDTQFTESQQLIKTNEDQGDKQKMVEVHVAIKTTKSGEESVHCHGCRVMSCEAMDVLNSKQHHLNGWSRPGNTDFGVHVL